MPVSCFKRSESLELIWRAALYENYFIFPVVTGLYAAYKKQFGLLGVHFSVTALALLLGGFGYGLSVEPVFLNRKNCRQHDEDLTCDKESLAWIYLVSGALAAGLAILGLLLTICACYHASVCV
nr:hypothetical protein BaRGS_004216 [Batillaria attramentaria]